jgi:hypothetical protein
MLNKYLEEDLKGLETGNEEIDVFGDLSEEVIADAFDYMNSFEEVTTLSKGYEAIEIVAESADKLSVGFEANIVALGVDPSAAKDIANDKDKKESFIKSLWNKLKLGIKKLWEAVKAMILKAVATLSGVFRKIGLKVKVKTSVFNKFRKLVMLSIEISNHTNLLVPEIKPSDEPIIRAKVEKLYKKIIPLMVMGYGPSIPSITNFLSDMSTSVEEKINVLKTIIDALDKRDTKTTCELVDKLYNKKYDTFGHIGLESIPVKYDKYYLAFGDIGDLNVKVYLVRPDKDKECPENIVVEDTFFDIKPELAKKIEVKVDEFFVQSMQFINSIIGKKPEKGDLKDILKKYDKAFEKIFKLANDVENKIVELKKLTIDMDKKISVLNLEKDVKDDSELKKFMDDIKSLVKIYKTISLSAIGTYKQYGQNYLIAMYGQFLDIQIAVLEIILDKIKSGDIGIDIDIEGMKKKMHETFEEMGKKYGKGKS